ncbi:hypothetical protein ACFWOJ_18890 [Streptomyces sp. NPDC058439]|uniref:hypothetical protein n=1 Tax=Streptomyces sp. NPDC058439 TaxID=3346500 RepID=UPI003649E961
MLPVSLFSLVDDQLPHHKRMNLGSARNRIRANHSANADVRVYETTDREGGGLHIAYVHYGPGCWSNADRVTYIFEIPTETLTEL